MCCMRCNGCCSGTGGRRSEYLFQGRFTLLLPYVSRHDEKTLCMNRKLHEKCNEMNSREGKRLVYPGKTTNFKAGVVETPALRALSD